MPVPDLSLMDPVPDPDLLLMDPDPGGPKTYGSYGSGSAILRNTGYQILV